MKRFLEENDVCLDVFEKVAKKRSSTVIIAKNLSANTTAAELQPMFAKFGVLSRLVLPPSGVTALIEFAEPYEAKAAFRKLAYSKFKDLPLYLEWAPENIFKTEAKKPMETIKQKTDDDVVEKPTEDKKEAVTSAEKTETFVTPADLTDDTPAEQNTTLFLRNLNFITREHTIREHFSHLGAIHVIQVALKKDPENPQNRISLGYGFLQFKKKATAERALNTMQFTTIEGNKVELKRSDRTLQ